MLHPAFLFSIIQSISTLQAQIISGLLKNPFLIQFLSKLLVLRLVQTDAWPPFHDQTFIPLKTEHNSGLGFLSMICFSFQKFSPCFVSWPRSCYLAYAFSIFRFDLFQSVQLQSRYCFFSFFLMVRKALKLFHAD